MDRERWQRLQEIFHEAAELPAAERDAFLDDACAGDDDLRRRVEALLGIDDSTGVDLGQPVQAAVESVLDSERLIGTQIGPYRIVERIGEGGFGAVYRAEQEEPIRREVALKVIKWGMDTREVIARFEAERQALALMDHPNIARVLDAGATDQGRPYFVMELVQGESITDYCDGRQLGTGDRLKLFLRVCGAVQHAHQKGIIHRDLKPSNVLVASADGEPLPKVIDFGIAKATQQRLTERTIFTQQRQLIGTPQYMSPEQVGAADVDTRSDIYSLGVLLYELLTGTTPFEPGQLRGAALDEIERIIREVDPVKPSSRISQITSRGTESSTLSKSVRGDLDWIVIKALEKDRDRRYDSAGDLAADIRRHLDDEPVLAGPPSRAYRLGKFARRHRQGVVAASLVLLALIAGLAVAAAGFLEARRERDRATAEATKLRHVSEFLLDLFEVSDPNEARGNSVTARELLDEGVAQLQGSLEEQPEILAELQITMGQVYQRLGLYEQSAPLLEQAAGTRRQTLGSEHPETLEAVRSTASLYRSQGRFDEAWPLVHEVLEVQRREFGDDDPRTLTTLQLAGSLHMATSEDEEAERVFREVLEKRRRVLGPRAPETVTTMGTLALLYWNLERYDEAEKLLVDALTIRREDLGDNHPDTLWSINKLANLHQSRGRYDEAETLFVEALESRRRVLGEEHPRTLWSVADLANLRLDQARYEEAEELHRLAFETRRRVLGEEHPDTSASRTGLGNLYWTTGRYEEAEPVYVEVLAINRRVRGDDHASTLKSINNLAVLYTILGRYDDAEPLYRETIEGRRRIYGDDNPSVLTAMSNLAGLYRRQKRYGDAERIYRETIDGRTAVLGANHPKTLKTRQGLADLYLAMERWAEAASLMEALLPGRREALGQDHPDVAGTMHHLARARSMTGDGEQAAALYEQALAILETKLGADHRKVADLLLDQASLLRGLDETERAARAEERARKIRAGN